MTRRKFTAPGSVDEAVVFQCRGTDDSAALTSAARTAKGGSIVITRGQTCAGGDIAIPNLHIQEGGLLKPITGHTVTLAGTFAAGAYQAFTNSFAGQGTIAFAPNASLNEIYPQWWGAKGDGSNDDTLPLNAAFAQLGRTVFVPRGSYKVTTNLTSPKCAAIVGAGKDQTIFVPTAAVILFIKLSNVTPVLRAFSLDGAATNGATGIVFGDKNTVGDWSGGEVSLLRIKNFKGNGAVGIRLADALKAGFFGITSENNSIDLLSQEICTGSGCGYPTTVTFRNCQFNSAVAAPGGGKGVKLVDGHSLSFEGCVFESNGQEGALLLPKSGGTLENILFVNGCWFEDNYRSDPTKFQFAAGDGTPLGSATIRPVLRDIVFTGNSRTAKSLNLNGAAVAGFVLDNVQVPNLPNEIKIQNGAYGTVKAAANLDPSVISPQDLF